MRRGEIWLYNADPTVGDEISKTRPCIIVNNDDIGTLRLKVIVPITGWNEVFAQVPWMIRIETTAENNLSKLSTAVSQQRLIKKVGIVAEEIMQEISNALAIVLNIK
jgi:mRNA interferase MazF